MIKSDTKKYIGRILLADDEETFATSTAELLRKEGYLCQCVSSSSQALEELKNARFDLLISDIKMPGNAKLELVEKAVKQTPALNIILITGYPSQQTAIEAVHLPVAAYMVKPIEFPELLKNVNDALRNSRLYKIVLSTKNSLSQWINELQNIEETLKTGKTDTFAAGLKSYLEITTAKIDATFADIRNITDIFNLTGPKTQICNMMKCSELTELTNTIEQTIDSIQKSKDFYKSKRLAEIRIRLQKLLENMRKI